MNQNNAAQPVLTDDEILHRWDAYVSEPSTTYPLTGADKIAFARAIESALLSKLRTPVADERAAFEKWTGYTEDALSRDAGDGYCIKGVDNQWRAWKASRAALASAPADERAALHHVANEWADMATSAIQWIRNIKDGVSTPEAALENLMSNLTHCQEVQSCAGVRPWRENAPVAGEAVAHAVISYGRIQRLVVNEESAHEYAEQQRLNAEAAGWDAKAHVRPLVYGDAAPQASTVGGQAQAPKRSDTEILRLFDQELDEIFPPLPRLSGKGAHWDAAPQGSEAVRDEDVVTLLNFIFERFSAPCKAGDLPGYVVPAIRRLERAALSAQPAQKEQNDE